MHACDNCGLLHEDMAAAPAEQAGEPGESARAEETVTEEVASATVEVARIEADRDVKVAKISAGVAEVEVESRLAEVEGQLRGMREALDRLVPEVPEPDPEPVVVAQEVAPEPTEAEMPTRAESHEPRAPKRKQGFF